MTTAPLVYYLLVVILDGYDQDVLPLVVAFQLHD